MTLEPEIRYAISRDGTRLAMSVQGVGPPLVFVTMHLGDRLDSPSTSSRHYHRDLPAQHCVVRFDARGCGLSDRTGGRLTFDACLEDLEAVVDAVAAGSVDLFVLSHGAPLAIAYAARHPHRVRRLVVYSGYARGRLRREPDEAHVQEAEAILRTMRVAFGADVPYRSAFLHAVNSRLFPRGTPQQLEEMDEAIAGRSSAEVAVAYTTMIFDVDVSEQARRLVCPALLFHGRGDLVVPFEEGRLLASLIPNARLVPLNDDSNVPLETNPHWPHVLAEIRQFLGTASSPSADAARDQTAKLGLTRRQTEVLVLVSRGHTDKEIARALSLSPRTIEMHAARALRVLDCRTRAEAIRRATQLGLLD